MNSPTNASPGITSDHRNFTSTGPSVQQRYSSSNGYEQFPRYGSGDLRAPTAAVHSSSSSHLQANTIHNQFDALDTHRGGNNKAVQGLQTNPSEVEDTLQWAFLNHTFNSNFKFVIAQAWLFRAEFSGNLKLDSVCYPRLTLSTSIRSSLAKED